MTTVETRRHAIRDILEKAEIASPKELLRKLAMAGFRTTQPVLSRDLRAVRASKRSGTYQILDGDRITPLENLRSLLRNARIAGSNLVVVNCEPGAAHAVARAIEAERIAGFVGSVAGDDTILAAVQSRDAGARLRRRVLALL
jgi:transcriptional regulator of arginine metabolism